MNYRLTRFGLLLLIACGVQVGCGGPERPPMGYVSGTVTMDGEPLEKVSVSIKPDVGRAAMGQTDGKGHYEIFYNVGEKGTKIGPSTVTLSWPMGYAGPKAIPAKYTEGKSELKLDVKKGQQTFDIAVESDPSAKPPKAQTLD